MVCEAEFVGGPADGQVRAFPGDKPPYEVTFSSWADGDFRYIREVSRRDDGPLWAFIPKAT